MASSNVCWGIEVGAGAVKALKLERTGDTLNVLDFAIIPHKMVLSSPDLDQTEATRVALGTLVSQYDLTGASIAVSVPGHSAFARFAKLPPVEPKEIPDIVKFEAVQQIPFPIDDVEWDYQTFASSDTPDVEVGIFAITRDRVMERLAMWADVGVTPDYVTLSPLAAYNAIAWDLRFTEKTPGTVILDVGTTSTDLVVAEAGRVWIRTFPIGGHQFTEALVGAFKLSYVKAEKLKREAETSKHARHVFQAMRPVFGDLAQDVQRSIGYYQSLHREANLTRLIGLGSTFNLPGLRKYLGQQLQMEVVRLEQFSRLSLEGARASDFQAATLNLATAYGLALQGLGLPTIDANLMPVTVLREALWRRKIKWFAVAAGLSLAAGGVSFLRPMMESTKINAAKPDANIARVKSEITRLKGEWKAVEGEYKADTRAANAARLLDGRDIFPMIADDLGQMTQDAQAHAEAKPEGGKPAGFRFVKFQTRYQGPGNQGGGMAENAMADDRRGVPAQTRGKGARRGEAPPPVATGAGPGGATGGPQGRVKVTLEVTTTRKDADEFVRDTFKKWLTEHSKRDGVDYTIENVSWERRGSQDIPAEVEKPKAAPTGAPGAPSPTKVPGQPPQDERRKPLRPGQYDPRYQDEYGNPLQGSTRPKGDSGGEAGGEAGGEGPAGGERTGGGPGVNADLEKVAPLPKPPPPGEPGTTVTTYEIRCDAVITPPPVKKEGDA